MNRKRDTLTEAKRPANTRPPSREKPAHAGLVNTRLYPAKTVAGLRFRRFSGAWDSSNSVMAAIVVTTDTPVSTTKIRRQEPKDRISAPTAGAISGATPNTTETA